MDNVTVTFGFRGKLIVNHPHEAIFTGHIPFGYNNHVRSAKPSLITTSDEVLMIDISQYGL